MSPNTKSSQQQQQPQFYATKTELYLKVKKPLLERQRRARINKCLDTLKTLVAEFQGDDAIMRMDKAEMLESTIAFMRQHSSRGGRSTMPALTPLAPMDSFRNGYMNAVNEVSRVMAAMPGMSVDVGKSVMTHLGSEFNRLLQQQQQEQQQPRQQQQTIVEDVEEKLCEKLSRPSSRASSGYHSDCALDSPMPSPAPTAAVESANWRPWL
ncbi:enhancer of split m8 protein-like [Rhagoletis pomonella]|uniref:enhancer of split m8 protein-like n=1 Tax=Rhagoletis pomonella TaxID=28610 RepID=UPI001782ED26|nr:enhancer of split m8 protein-like [Rhagoletis pomonella]